MYICMYLVIEALQDVLRVRDGHDTVQADLGRDLRRRHERPNNI